MLIELLVFQLKRMYINPPIAESSPCFCKASGHIRREVGGCNRRANPFTKVMSVTLIPKRGLKNRTQNEQIISFHNLVSYEMFTLN